MLSIKDANDNNPVGISNFKITYKNNTKASKELKGSELVNTYKSNTQRPQINIVGIGAYKGLKATVYFDIIPNTLMQTDDDEICETGTNNGKINGVGDTEFSPEMNVIDVAEFIRANASGVKLNPKVYINRTLYAGNDKYTTKKVNLSAKKDYTLQIIDKTTGSATEKVYPGQDSAPKKYEIRITGIGSYQGSLTSFDVNGVSKIYSFYYTDQVKAPKESDITLWNTFKNITASVGDRYIDTDKSGKLVYQYNGLNADIARSLAKITAAGKDGTETLASFYLTKADDGSKITNTEVATGVTGRYEILQITPNNFKNTGTVKVTIRVLPNTINSKAASSSRLGGTFTVSFKITDMAKDYLKL